MWFLSRFYTADEADKMGLVNIVVPVSAENYHQLPKKQTVWILLMH
jgi:1,4-dihydroxy-2-naphthoyl-CoA synthase